MKTKMNLATRLLVAAVFVATAVLPDITFARAPGGAHPSVRAAGRAKQISVRYGKGRRRVRTGNKQQPFKSSKKPVIDKPVTISGTVGSNGTTSSYSFRGDDHKTYTLTGHESELAGFLAKRVQISGKLTAKSGKNTITVQSVKAAQAP